MKTVLTAGVYDLMHIGHIKLFERAKKFGDNLIVAVQKDQYVKVFKPNVEVFYNVQERIYMVESIKYVDNVIAYDTIDNIVTEVDFDILAVGPDQTNESFQRAFEWCRKNNKDVIVLPRTSGISSSLIRATKKTN